MSDSDLQSKTFTGGFTELHVFHNNLRYREVIATLRYGIEARKGLILFSGEAGTGKTTIIQRLVEELDPSVTCIVESNPGINFTELLSSILRHLRGDAECNTHDALSMIDHCKAVLRAQRDQGQILCLIIDNAQQLDELTLEYLMETFFPSDGESGDKNILQVVLAGRPPMREKLLHPWLRPLNPHLGLVCHIEPLTEREVAPFVSDQLRGSKFPVDAIEPDAIRRIFEYTSGNPRLIHELSLGAVQLAQGSANPVITRELVATAARDVGLLDEWRSRRTHDGSLDFSGEPEPKREAFEFEASEAATTDMLMETFLRDNPPPGRRWFANGSRWGKGVRILLPLVLIILVAAWMEPNALLTQLTNWIQGFRTMPDSTELASGDKPQNALPLVPPETAPAPVVTPRSSSAPPRPVEQSASSAAPVEEQKVEEEKFEELSAPTPDEISPEKVQPDVKPPAPQTKDDEQGPRAEPVEVRNKHIEAQVQKAIGNRAIEGVQVSVINGTAVLQGRVASERQKQAAERAAHSVEGVQRVRNRIVVR
jgi:type II secretory pathway predicted ATPase ExeA